MRTVKAWAIIDRETGDLVWSLGAFLVDRFKTRSKDLHKDYESVPCTVTYTTYD